MVPIKPVLSRRGFLMESALLVARRGTCSRNSVGCVAARDGRVVASGYNGSPRGMDHCDHDHAKENNPQYGVYPGCQEAVHAEANLISFSARHGIPLEGCHLFCTHSPCLKCAQLIINSGIKKVTYNFQYRIKDGEELLRRAGIEVEQYLEDER